MKPCIIFIDEVDSVARLWGDTESESARRNFTTEFLYQMDGGGQDDSGLWVIDATNVPWDLDSSVRKRFSICSVYGSEC
jgi:vacuolar protein-sorting-associated protein 4